ncbi:MAG: bifunctional folylpolyglutamate synthase/dihydrofolate synthase [Ruminococcaceae bacterium]|nr:bifunctional folylpolyglutamate synthase/dihydrofolate synthase [Oscillospiraceae bacterium]
MTYTEALSYIHNINWQFCNPGLSRTRALCEKLGNPEKKLRFIHVAGTNGKGSFCAMLAAILSAAGYKTGLYTSPFIRRFNERMQIDGACIGDEELAEITSYIRPFADSMDEKPTEFELVTAIGFEYFCRHECDVVVLETGLGGRLDSTNVIESSLLSVITGIDFDHTALLGNTIQAIAREKAGIIKHGCPCLYGSQDAAALRTIRAVAHEKNAPFYAVDRSTLRVKSLTLDGTVFDYEDYTDLSLSLLGTYQPLNAATVLTAVRILCEQGDLAISESAIRKGLSTVAWPARFELLNRELPILYDGGHNAQGISAAVESIRTYFPGQTVNLLTGVMADKGYDEMIEKLKPIAAHVFTVCPGGARALSAEDYAKHFVMHHIEATAHETVEAGVRAAVLDSREKGIPLVCLGSLYLYLSATEALQKVLGGD